MKKMSFKRALESFDAMLPEYLECDGEPVSVDLVQGNWYGHLDVLEQNGYDVSHLPADLPADLADEFYRRYAAVERIGLSMDEFRELQLITFSKEYKGLDELLAAIRARFPQLTVNTRPHRGFTVIEAEHNGCCHDFIVEYVTED